MTTSPNATTTAAFFEQKYRAHPDPWKFATSSYERARYERTIAALGKQRYARAFEPGCSIGVLTERLAACCDAVEAMDISATAVQKAQERCLALTNVHVRTGALPEGIPEGWFDLVVLSEIGYYFTEPALAALVDALAGRISKGGTLLAVHWLGSSPDHILSGDQVHAVLRAQHGLQLEAEERTEHFRLDRWVRS